MKSVTRRLPRLGFLTRKKGMDVLYRYTNILRLSDDTKRLQFIELRLKLRQPLAVILRQVTSALRRLNRTDVHNAAIILNSAVVARENRLKHRVILCDSNGKLGCYRVRKQSMRISGHQSG